MELPIIPKQVSDRPKRRSYPKDFKTELVAQCNKGEHSLAQIAMDNQINANLLRKWQREAKRQQDNSFIPVQVANRSATSGSIEIVLGNLVVRFNGQIDPVNARTVLDLLR